MAEIILKVVEMVGGQFSEISREPEYRRGFEAGYNGELIPEANTVDYGIGFNNGREVRVVRLKPVDDIANEALDLL